MTKVSVIMPAFNAGKYVGEAIQSVLNQTFNDFELIIINDGSTDNTEIEVLNFSDNRIKYFKNSTNLRLVETLNRGLSLATGEYVFRMDADDISHQDRFKIQIEFMDNNPDVGVCGTLLETFGMNNELILYPQWDEQIKPCILYRSLVAHATVCIRRKLLVDNGIKYSEEFIHIEDIDLWSKLLNITKFHNIQKVLYRYRIFGDNTTELHRFSRGERYFNFLSSFFTRNKIPYKTEVLKFHVYSKAYYKINREIILEYLDWLNEIDEWNKKHNYFDKAGLYDAFEAMKVKALKCGFSFGNFKCRLFCGKALKIPVHKLFYSYLSSKLKARR